MRLPDNIQRQFFVCNPKEKIKTEGISVLITIHGKERLKQLYNTVMWAINQTITPLEIIIIEDGVKPLIDLTYFKEYPEVKYYFIKNDGLFCKCACYNHGASMAKYNYLCGIDADLLIPTDFLLSGYIQLQKYDVCFLADDIYFLEGDMEDMFDFNFSGKTWQTHRAKWQFHGGSFFIKKQKYFDIGGHDEKFKGYGSEDSEFYKRVHDLLKTNTSNYTVLHQDHNREITGFENIEINKNYLYNIQDINLRDRVNYLKQHNHYLISEMLNNQTTIIPDTIPINIDQDERMRRLNHLQSYRTQLNKKLINGKTNIKNTPPIIYNDNEKRRRRVLGFN